MIELSVIIPTMERPGIFARTLEAMLRALEVQSFSWELLVVNDSKKSRPAITAEQAKRVEVLDHPGQGVAGARNFGAKNAQGKFLLFVDDDMLVKAENIARTYRFLQEYPNRVYAANWVYPKELLERLDKDPFGRYLIQFGFVTLEGWENSKDWDPKAPFECLTVAATYLPVAKANFDHVGGFDETFPFAGFEDYDLAVRLRKSGTHLYIDPLNMIEHNESDRLDMRKWLLRKRRSAQTRKIGVERGYEEAAVTQKGWKYVFYYCNRPFREPWMFFTRCIPNIRFLDPLRFRLINFLLALELHIGYFHRKKKKGYL